MTRYYPYRTWSHEDPERWRNAEREAWPATDLHDRINRLVDESFESGDGSSEDERFEPPAEMLAEDERYCVSLELAGVRHDDLSVRVSTGRLRVRGEKNRPAGQDGSEVLVSARRFGSFVREFDLPEDAVRDGIVAELDGGVLTIAVPRDRQSGQNEMHEIAIRTRKDNGR